VPLTSFLNLPASRQVIKMANWSALLDPIVTALNAVIAGLKAQVECMQEEEALMMRRYEVLEEYAAERDRKVDYYRTVVRMIFDVGDAIDHEIWSQLMQQLSTNQFNGEFDDEVPSDNEADNWEVRESVRRRLFE